MQKIIIKYNPYIMKTEIIIEGTNIATDNTLGSYYENLKSYLDSGIPLQTWIEPIPGTTWNGILAELKDDDFSDTIQFDFYGREIDYQDFKRTCESQNEQRNFPLTLDFVPHITLSDKKTLDLLEDVKNKLYSDEFKSIMASYSSDSELAKEYQLIERKYEVAKSNEFRVVFAGLFSSGKSLIINTLIRRDILPIADETCTSKICRIIHDSSLTKEQSLLECFDINDNSVYPQESFSSDADCRQRILEISMLSENDANSPKFDYFALRVNLSHLYPNAELINEFTLTIIDTPGTDSAKTRGKADSIEGEENNLHRQITLNAITHQNKDMVVLCFPHDKVESEKLGDLISTIYNTSESDRNSFCDRFLFVANRCDERKFGSNIAARKELMVETLTDPIKLGIKAEEVCFIPQVFLSSALIEYAIQSHAAKYTCPEEADDEKMYSLIGEYQKYKNALCSKFKDNSMLARYSGNPSYVKDEFENKFNKCMAEGSIEEAVSLQTGIPCIARAIRDYLERYAIPFKAAALLHTFDYFIEAVNDQLEEKNRIVVELELKQGENEQQGKGAKEKQEAAQKRNQEREAIKKVISDAKASVEAISFTNALINISNRLEEEFELKSDIAEIRTASQEKLEFTREQVEAKMVAVQKIFTIFCTEAEYRFSTFASQYQSELQKILDNLKAIGQNISSGDTAAKCSKTFNSIKEWSVDSLRDDIDQTKTRKTIETPNPIKTVKYKWWQLGKKLKQWWAEEKIKEEKDVYTVEPISQELTKKLNELKKFFKSAETEYSEDLAKIKNSVAEKLDAIEKEISQGEQEILTFAEELEHLISKREELEEKIHTVRKQKVFLDSLIASYNFGG